MTDQHVRARPGRRVPTQRTPTPGEPAPAPRPPRRAARRALLVPLTLGGVAVLAAVATATTTLLGTDTTHAFTLTSTAAGMTRDPAQEAAYADQVSGVRATFQEQFRGRLSQFVTAVYDHPTAAAGRPRGAVVFVGAAIDTHGDPEDFVEAFRTRAEATGATVTTPDVGDGALGVCSQSGAAPAVTACAWSTGDSVGQVVPTVDGWDSASLGAATKEFRAALETSTAR